MSAIAQSPGTFIKWFKVLGLMFLGGVLALCALFVVALLMNMKQDRQRAAQAQPGTECRVVGSGNAQTRICTTITSNGDTLVDYSDFGQMEGAAVQPAPNPAPGPAF